MPLLEAQGVHSGYGGMEVLHGMVPEDGPGPKGPVERKSEQLLKRGGKKK